MKTAINNPVKRGYALRLPSLLPRFLQEEQSKTFDFIDSLRGLVTFKLMLRGAEEVANLTLDAVDFLYRKFLAHCGKGKKDRIVYISMNRNLAESKLLICQNIPQKFYFRFCAIFSPFLKT